MLKNRNRTGIVSEALQFSMSSPYRLNLSRMFGRACASEHSLLACTWMLAHLLPLRSNQQILFLHY